MVKHVIRVCGGKACRKCGSKKILKKSREMIKPDNEKFELESVECVGYCKIAPVIKIDNTLYGKINETDAESLIAHEKKKEEE